MNKALIENYFNMTLFTYSDLDLFVKGGYITEEEKESILSSPINIELIKKSNKYKYTYGMYYFWNSTTYHCLDVNSITPSDSYGQTFTSQFTPDLLVGRFFEVVS